MVNAHPNTVQLQATRTSGILQINTSELFRDVRTVCIEHGNQHYFLRQTREGKLILTK